MPAPERHDLNVPLLRISIKSDKCMEAILGFLVFGSKFSYALDIVVSSVCGIENQKLTFCHSGCRSLSVSPRQIRLTRESRLDQRRSLTALLSISNCQLLCNEGSHTCMTIASKTEEKDSIPKLVRGETYTHSQSGYSEDCIPPGDACGLNWGAVNLFPAG